MRTTTLDDQARPPLHLSHSLVVRRDDRWWLLDLLAENMTFDEVRQPDSEFMADEFARWNGKDLCRRISFFANINVVRLFHLRSNSSSVSCLVSLTKQKIMPQAIKFSPA